MKDLYYQLWKMNLDKCIPDLTKVVDNFIHSTRKIPNRKRNEKSKNIISKSLNEAQIILVDLGQNLELHRPKPEIAKDQLEEKRANEIQIRALKISQMVRPKVI